MTRQERSVPRARGAVTDAEARGRILVVDDHHDLAELLTIALARRGFQVRNALPVARAPAAAAEFDPHVVLLDLHLGELDGCELGRRIQEQAPRDVQIVVLTGDAGRIASERCDGFAARLLKPIALRELAEIIAVLQPRAVPRGAGRA